MRIVLNVMLLSLFFAPQVPADMVTSVVGNVVLTRNQQQFQARIRAYLNDGDTLSISQNSGVSFALNNAFVYTGPDSQIQIEDGTLRIDQGQVRIVSRMNQRLTIVTPNGNMVLNGGIHRIAVSNDASRFACETGSAELQWMANSSPQRWTPNRAPGVAQVSYQGDAQHSTVTPGREHYIVNGQLVNANPRSTAPWNINVAMLQQQSVNDARNELINSAGAPQGVGQGQTVDGSVAPGQTVQAVDDPLRQPTSDNAADTQRAGNQPQSTTPLQRPPDASATQFGSNSFASIFTGFASTAGSSASGGLFADANQSTNQGRVVDAPPGSPFSNGETFAGNIFPLTADMAYGLKDLMVTELQLNNIFAASSQLYFSVGAGSVPTTQVSTDFSTGTGPVPNAIKLPGFDNYVIQLDQYGITDPIDQPQAVNSTVGITGLVGSVPSSPSVTGATPTIDLRAQINQGATFALGEFRMARANGTVEIAVRRSDQDRRIVKSIDGNDANDQVTPNSDVEFENVVDPRFLPAAPTVKQPLKNTFNQAGTNFRELNNLRRAAVTTILADQLYDVARETGQTRFAVDGKIIDISGYRK